MPCSQWQVAEGRRKVSVLVLRNIIASQTRLSNAASLATCDGGPLAHLLHTREAATRGHVGAALDAVVRPRRLDSRCLQSRFDSSVLRPDRWPQQRQGGSVSTHSAPEMAPLPVVDE